MQQFMLIPEIPAIIRKTAPYGRHIAVFQAADYARMRYRQLAAGLLFESDLTWQCLLPSGTTVRHTGVQ